MHISCYEQDYQNYHISLLADFTGQIKRQLPFSASDCSEEDQEYLAALEQLQVPANQQHAEFLPKGQELLCKVVASYPHLMPLLYRDLLWFFGGDCLHFMPDEEIALFQRLDEQRQEAIEKNQPFTYKEVRAKILGLH